VDTAPRLRGRLLRGGHPGVGRWSGGNGRGSGPYGSRESDLYGARRPAERDNGGQRGIISSIGLPVVKICNVGLHLSPGLFIRILRPNGSSVCFISCLNF